MSLRQQLEDKLKRDSAAELPELVNESQRHSVPPGSETHWNVIIVSARFDDLSAVRRHQAIYHTLAHELHAGVHALTIKALTPAGWHDANAQVDNPSPPVLEVRRTKPPPSAASRFV
jgi:BolA protein